MAETEKNKASQAAAGATAEAGDFASLLQKSFKPQTDRARDEVESAVRTMAQQALAKSTDQATMVVAKPQSVAGLSELIHSIPIRKSSERSL